MNANRKEAHTPESLYPTESKSIEGATSKQDSKSFEAQDPKHVAAFDFSLLLLGLGLTFLYLLCVGGFIIAGPIEHDKLTINELGDFLAGFFAPLAFLWLILGFVQQGIELRLNSNALRLQVEELRQTAEHAGNMVKHANEESIRIRKEKLIETRSAAQPDFAIAEQFVITRFHNSEAVYSLGIDFINTGYDTYITEIQLDQTYKDSTPIELHGYSMGSTPNNRTFRVNLEYSHSKNSAARLNILYQDKFGEHRVTSISLLIEDNLPRITQIIPPSFDEAATLVG